MSHGSKRWHSPAGLGLELYSRLVWRAMPMGLDQPVQSIITAPGVVMMSSEVHRRGLPPHVFHACPWGVRRRSWQDPLATRPEALSCGTGHEPSLVRHFLPARGETLSCKLPSPQGGEAFTSSSPQRGKGNAWHPATPCRGFCRRHHPWTPSRKWLRAKGCHHDKASEDTSQGSLMTSSRSSVAGASLDFTMPLAPRLFVTLHWLSPTSCERGVPRPRLFVARTAAIFVFFLQVGCGWLFAARKLWPTGRQCLGPVAAW
jgi:hypothetical protein